jgi:hypothetical protein
MATTNHNKRRKSEPESHLLLLEEGFVLMRVGRTKGYELIKQKRIPERCLVDLGERCKRFRRRALIDWLDGGGLGAD